MSPNNQKNHKKTSQSYNVYFPLYNVYVYALPDAYQLAHAKLLYFHSLPARVRELFEFNWKFQFEKKETHTSTLEEYSKKMRDIVFLQISVNAHNTKEANQEAFKLAEESVNVIRIIYDYYFPLSERMIMDEKQRVGELSKLGTKPTSTQIGALDYLAIDKLTDILTKQDPNDIEKRLRNAIRLFGIETGTARPEIRYVLLVTALETLLIAGRGGIGFKLAEKITFLLEKPKERKNRFKKVKDIYKKRSNFVHQHPKYKPITDEDVKKLRKLVRRVFKKILELRDKGYTQIREENNKPSPGKSINELVENLKFD